MKKTIEMQSFLDRWDLRFDPPDELQFRSNEATHKNYNSHFKSRFRSFFVSKVLQVRIRNKSKLDSFVELQRTFLAARFLLFLGGRNIAVNLLERVIRKSEKENDTLTVLLCAQLLRHHYGVLKRDNTKYRFYQRKAAQSLKKYQVESLADSYLEELLYWYQARRKSKVELIKLAVSFDQKLSLITKDQESILLQHRLRFIRVIHRMSLNDYADTAKSCEEALAYFSKQQAVPRSYLRAYLFQLIVCRIQLGQFKKAEISILELQRMVVPGNSNWFKLLEMHCITCLRAKEYDQAFSIWQRSISQSAFSKLYASDKEIWHLVEAFLNYLAGAENNQLTNLKFPPFRLGRFLNQVPLLTQDKQGYNVTILIIQILFLLRKKKHDPIIDRMESIEKYAHRYLRGEAHRRSRFFLKMVAQLPKSGFHPARMKNRVKPWHQKLLATPASIAREPHEIEIVPYEELWEMILQDLERNKKTS